MSAVWQMIISGVTSGSIYALVGLGLGIIYNVSKVINLAQGEFLTWGALLLISLTGWGLPLGAAIALAVIMTAGIGIIFERLAIRPAWKSSTTVLLIATLAVSIVFKGIAMIGWGKDPLSAPSFSGEEPVRVGQTVIATQVFWVVGVLILIAALSWYFFNRTLAGKAILAVSENRDAAALVGIDVRLSVLTAFALSAAVGALAGAVIAPITFVTYDSGTMIGLKGFIALTLGGMGSIWGGIIGGVLLGLVEALGAGLISAQYKDLIAFVLLIIVLYAKPAGILSVSGKRV
ncbi:branched-chain amino acid ABC transporter permease [Paradesulfitobacterium ferrireducens]|uniref:branched-chain amino acid ABC transporter permease n=1 Tax=Paradesulfitobacterium ferrireducens TaxID=2816476 RepID=UPI001A8DFC46|nr:branched-chain amino acid ABC transporter permease [Paradesulfitobacterium ferrireducens]